jgi:hypothetical protein
VLLAPLAVSFGDSEADRPVLAGPYVAQEIWVTYNHEEFNHLGRRDGTPRDEARQKAEALRERVLRGEDIGALAIEHSGAPGGSSEGFSDWRGDPKRNPLDARDHELMRTPVGGVTKILDWLGGWWFAKRVSAERGRELEVRFRWEIERAARIAVIAIKYKGSWPQRYDDKWTLTKEEAHALAESLLARALAGEDFGALAAQHSYDENAKNGGVVRVLRTNGERTEWIKPQEEVIERAVLKAAFEGEIGKVWPHVIDGVIAVYLVKVLERRP